MLAKRIVPCLDVRGGRVVKGVNFARIVDAGDPVELARRYEAEGADELVLLDITATIEDRTAMHDVVRDVAAELSMPFTVGGGMRSVADMRAYLRDGCDKVSINSAAVRDPGILRVAAAEFGRQCVVLAIDARRRDDGWEVVIDGGRTPTGRDAVEWAREAEELGAGELLVTSMDRDGTKAGFDCALVRAIRESTNVPIVASGGAGSVADFITLFESTGADAALAASLFHFSELSIGDLKAAMRADGIPVRSPE